MTFFNKKTDVISVELTQYGKYLLSIGKLKPVYYDFFDNDILYDGQYGSITESRNNIQERIKNETPSLKPQYVYYGLETNLKQQLKLKRENKNFILQQPEDKIYFTSSPLGTSDLDNNLPGIELLLHESEISSSSYVKQINNSLIRIPQIDLKDCKYEVFFERNEEMSNLTDTFIYGPNYAENNEIIFRDGTSVKFDKQDILIELNETNIRDMKENFEIELYEITSSADGKETYNQLFFYDFSSNGNEYTTDTNLVEYFLNVSVDQEIDSKTLEKISTNPLYPRIYQEIKK